MACTNFSIFLIDSERCYHQILSFAFCQTNNCCLANEGNSRFYWKKKENLATAQPTKNQPIGPSPKRIHLHLILYLIFH